jgi:glyoxylase-like metal-dependent hydrolase (beta-lactamase superfamily II)
MTPDVRSIVWLSAVAWMLAGCGDDGSSASDATTQGASSSATSTTAAGSTTAASLETTGVATSGSAGTTTPGADSTSAGSSDGSSDGETTSGLQTCRGRVPVEFDDGTNCGASPVIEVHQFDANTVILRQSLCTSFEGPLMYLLFGTDQVLLQDTGAGGIPIAATVQGIVSDWLAANGRTSIELLVTNSHGHGDHTAGNGQFAGLPDTTVVGSSQAAVAAYFGIDDWPTQIITHDLGGRLVDVIPIPGHQSSHVALYDHDTGWLMTGDTLYPGRLYIDDFPTYVTSINRLVDHTADLEVCQVMGTHIEMTNTPGQDFAFGATMHPDEHPLALTRDHLVELRDAVMAMGGSPVVEAHDDFIVYPL